MVRRTFSKGFTLIELLTVITIIAILASITFGAFGVVQGKAAKSRASVEIAAIGLACTRYQVDNGDFPAAQSDTNPTTVYKGITTSSDYLTAGKALFLALLGRETWADTSGTGTEYLPLKDSQTETDNNKDYIVDPFGLAYGYYYNPSGIASNSGQKSLFNYVEPDIWSTTKENKNPSNLTDPIYLNWSKNWED